MVGLCLASQVRGDCGLTARTSPRVDDESPRQGSDALAYIFAAPARHGDDRPPTATDPVTTVTDGDKPAFRSDAKQSMCLHTSLSRDDRLALGGCTASIEVGFMSCVPCTFNSRSARCAYLHVFPLWFCFVPGNSVTLLLRSAQAMRCALSAACVGNDSYQVCNGIRPGRFRPQARTDLS